MHDPGLAVVGDGKGVVWVGFNACDWVTWFVVPDPGCRDPVDVVAGLVALAVCWHWFSFLRDEPIGR